MPNRAHISQLRRKYAKVPAQVTMWTLLTLLSALAGAFVIVFLGALLSPIMQYGYFFFTALDKSPFTSEPPFADATLMTLLLPLVGAAVTLGSLSFGYARAATDDKSQDVALFAGRLFLASTMLLAVQVMRLFLQEAIPSPAPYPVVYQKVALFADWCLVIATGAGLAAGVAAVVLLYVHLVQFLYVRFKVSRGPRGAWRLLTAQRAGSPAGKAEQRLSD